ncbi:cation transporter [Salinisphaera hydrothermalis]|uniref:cation transporter n=1 Tax=Salinisphaera hydrothermalis TaxID=563188 RepID=UPI00333F0BC1
MTERSRSQPRRPGQLPAEKHRDLTTARRQEWGTLILRVTVVVVLYAALGASQALHAVWLKSLWSLLPPLAFLVAVRIESWPPTRRFPYGFYRAGSIAFLTSALALTCMGGYLIFAGARSLIEQHQPSLATIDAAGGPTHWAGWWIIAALAYSVAVPWIIGRRRQQLAIDLHDKGLYADASMGRVNWLAGSAAIIGVLGIGFGVWWLDFAAALAIGLDITWHGLRHLYTAVCDLIDEIPRRIGSSELDPLGADIRDFLRGQEWIRDARVRLREEGRLLTGIALICPNEDEASLALFESAREEIETMDWRLLDFQLVPVCDTTFERYCIDAHGRWSQN